MKRSLIDSNGVTILPYVKSNRSGDDTGVRVSDSIVFQIDFMGYKNIDEQSIFGSWQYDGNIYGITYYQGRWFYGYGVNTEYNVAMPISFTSRQTLLYNKSKGFYVNGTKVASLGNFSHNQKNPILIFGRSVYSSNGEQSSFPQYNTACLIKFYGCKIWNNEILIRDFYPAKDFNGKICLYEAVNKKFYYDINNSLFID